MTFIHLPISYPHIWPLCGRKLFTYKFYSAMHTRGTRRMFLKMEQRWSLEKLGVTPVQRNCCMGCLLPWWIHQMRCALACLRIVCPCKAWIGCLQVDGSIQAGYQSIRGMNVLSSGEAWVHCCSCNRIFVSRLGVVRHPSSASSSPYLILPWC
jgi:hypothetical protein